MIKDTKGQQKSKKTMNQVALISTQLSITTLKINELDSQIKKYGISNEFLKDPIVCWQYQSQFTFKDTQV